MNYDSASKWAKEKGYPFCKLLNWVAFCAGYLWFLVSKDGEEWHLMGQVSFTGPVPNFACNIDEGFSVFGTAEEALEQVNYL